MISLAQSELAGPRARWPIKRGRPVDCNAESNNEEHLKTLGHRAYRCKPVSLAGRRSDIQHKRGLHSSASGRRIRYSVEDTTSNYHYAWPPPNGADAGWFGTVSETTRDGRL